MAESITRKNIDLDILDYYDGKIKNYVDDKVGTGGLTIDDTLSDTSTNPVQNKVVKQAIDNKADKTVATISADGLMSAEDKGKLDAFEITTTGGKLHDKDIATTDLIPTSLPANGGNADTVGGKVPEKIFYDNGLAADLNGATQSGCYATSPDTLNVPFSAWWLVDTTNYNNQFIVQKAHTIGNTAHTVPYIRNYANNAWSDWEQISTTPIKAVEVGGTTNIHGNFMIWKASDRKIPIYGKIAGYYVSPFLIFTADDYYYYLGLCDAESHEWVANMTVSGTVYYIEI